MCAALDPDRSEWDVVVIGGAPPGENVAQYATQFSGLDAVIVERELVGGECSYWACMPSKALLRAVDVFNTGRNLPGVKEILDGRRLDVAAVLARRDAVVHDHDDSSQVSWATGAGIDVVRGHGRLAGPRRVEVTTPGGGVRTITARHAVVLDTGSSAAIPPIPGLCAARPWISRDVTNMHEIPRRIVVIGGGVVACEAVTWLHALGAADITIVEGSSRVLAKSEPFVGEILGQRFRDAGISVRTGTRVTAVHRAVVTDSGVGRVHGGEVTLTLDDGVTLTADEVLVAAGRRPNSDDVGLESVGLAAGGFITVDDHFTVEGVEGQWLYAVGDVCGRALLTHMGKYHARLAGEVIAARAAGVDVNVGGAGQFNRYTDVADKAVVPQVTFTDPEVGSAGLTEQQARAAGINVETVEYDTASVAGSYLFREDYVGRSKLVIDKATDLLVGATFVGAGIAELVHSATVTIVGKVPVPALWHAVPSYPTISEVWLRLLETLDQQRRAA